MEESRTVRLSFAEGESETVYVTELAVNYFRLEQTPITGADEQVYLGDTIEATLQADGTYHFEHVVERAPLQHYSWVVPEFFVKSMQYREYGAAVENAGGSWEGLMGGWLLVHIPDGSTFDADTELDGCIAAAKPIRPNRWWQFWKKNA